MKAAADPGGVAGPPRPGEGVPEGIKISLFLHKSVQNSANFLLSMETP